MIASDKLSHLKELGSLVEFVPLASVANPKMVLLSAETSDLEQVPRLKDSIKILVLHQATEIILGASIDYLITIGKEAYQEQNPQLELNVPDLTTESLQKIAQFCQSACKREHKLLANGFYVICLSSRPGTATFMYQLEWQIQQKTGVGGGTTDDDANEVEDETDVDIFMVEYAGLNYLVVGANLKWLPLAQQIVSEMGMKLTNGRPRSSAAPDQHFPISYAEDSIFTLEHLHPEKIPRNPIKLRALVKREIELLIGDKLSKK